MNDIALSACRQKAHFRAFWTTALAVLAALLLMVAVCSKAALAEEATWTGYPDDGWTPEVVVSFGQESYGPDDRIDVTVTGTNDLPVGIISADLNAEVPEGYSVVEGSSTAHMDRIESGESISTSFVLAKDSAAGSPVAGKASSLVSTGDSFGKIVAALALLALAALVCLLLSRKSVRKRASSFGRKTFVVFLALSLVAGQTVIAPRAEADEAEASASSEVGAVGTGSGSVTVGGETRSVSATLTVEDSDLLGSPTGSGVTLTADDGVAAGATESTVTVVSEPTDTTNGETGEEVHFEAAVFSDDISAEDMSLSMAFEGCEISSVKRIDDTTVEVSISGAVDASREDGEIDFSHTAFEESEEERYGSVLVAINDPSASIEETEDGYDETTGLFRIPVSTEAAQFVEGLTPSCFSTPSNSSIVVKSAERSDGHNVVLSFDVPGATPTEQFHTLDAALTTGGVLISDEALNCGSLTALSPEVEEAKKKQEENGNPLDDEGNPLYSATALGYADVVAMALLSGCSFNQEKMAFDLEIDILAANGTFFDDFEDLSIWVDDSLENGLIDFDAAEMSVGEDGTVAVTLPVSKEWAEEIKDLDESSLCDAFSWSVTSHDLMADGAFANIWGISESTISIPFAMVGDDSGAQLLESAESYNSKVKKAQGGLAIAKDVCGLISAGAKIVGAGGKEDGGSAVVSASFDCVSSILGIISDALGLSLQEESYSLTNVMNKLESMDDELRTISSQVDSLSIQMASLGADMKYSADVKQFSALLSRVASYDSCLSEATQSLDKSDPATLFDQMSTQNKTAFNKLQKSMETIEKLNGTTAYRDFQELTNYIAGSSTLGSQSIVDEYFDYVDTLYNWGPETYLAKTTYLEYISLTYRVGYSATMAELSSQISKTTDKDVIKTLRSQQDAVIESFQKTTTKIMGEYDDSGKLVKESSYYASTKDRADGKVLNLVNGKLYDTKESNPSRPSALSIGDFTNFPSPQVDLGSVGTISYGSSFTLSELQTMQSRLSKLKAKDEAFANIGNLADEMKNQKVLWNTHFDGKSYSLGRAKVTYNGGDLYQYLVSDVTCNKPKGNNRYWYADVYDITTGELTQNKQIIYGHRWWKCFHHYSQWSYEVVGLHPSA